MTAVKNLLGQKFGRLTVIERAENAKNGHARWLCRCDCGQEVVARTDHLLTKFTQSCGCLRREIHTKHGECGKKIYKNWGCIIQRCTNPKNPGYKNYGGRGIIVYPDWINDFQAFYDYVSNLEHYGEKGYSLDRIDNNGNYEPNNLRFADKKTQGRNRRTNHIVEYEGKKIPIVEVAEKSGINKNTLLKRIKKGDTGDRLFRPVRVKSSTSHKSS